MRVASEAATTLSISARTGLRDEDDARRVSEVELLVVGDAVRADEVFGEPRLDDVRPLGRGRVGRVGRREDVFETASRPTVLGVREHVEDSAGEIHDAETMLETLVGRGRIDEPGEGELVNVPEELKSARVDDFAFVGREDDESVDRITELVVFLRHNSMVAAANATG